MRFALAFLVLVAAMLAAPLTRAAAETYRQETDLLVIGRLENLSYEHVDIPGDDFLGHGWMTARLHVVRLVRGRAPRSELKVRYFGHSYIAEDQDFRLHLRRSRKGYFYLCALDGSQEAICR